LEFDSWKMEGENVYILVSDLFVPPWWAKMRMMMFFSIFILTRRYDYVNDFVRAHGRKGDGNLCGEGEESWGDA
jgi:hypothetical protein